MTTIPRTYATTYLDGLEFELNSGTTLVFNAEVHPRWATKVNVTYAYDEGGEDCPVPELTGTIYALLKERAEEVAYDY